MELIPGKQEWFDIRKSIRTPNNRLKQKKKKKKERHCIINWYTKGIDKIQHCSVIGSLRKSLIERYFLNMINSIYGKNTSNNILSDKRLKAFSQRSETRYGCPLLPLQLVIMLEFLEQLEIKKKKGRKEVKLYVQVTQTLI